MTALDPIIASEKKQHDASSVGRRWILSGTVQGVGFRPFVYRLAREYGLNGWVRNCAGQVEVLACGSAECLHAFGHDLVERAPQIAQPVIERVETVQQLADTRFRILDSEKTLASDIHVPVDYFVCQDCLNELNDPANRRYRYPFINCTQCGPRYTLIERLPYDRQNTSMVGFRLCADCQREYSDALDRRFHAEPVACPICGPQLLFSRDGEEIADSAEALAACVSALQAGWIVAVKGVGGYHLMCDAANTKAVQRLRETKPRPHKPLALMFPDEPGLSSLRRLVKLGAAEEALLRSPVRPIVLAARTASAAAMPDIAPGLTEIGVMLPYSPLHQLLLSDFGRPLVATSANITGEPVMTQARDVESRLHAVAQAFVHHDRPVVRPADDPVYRHIQGKCRPLRLGRGNAPAELRLPVTLQQPVLAVGAHMKNTLCLAWGDRAVVSPHIGDMGSARSLRVFEQLVDDLQRLYDVQAETLLCDLHPGYPSARWARQQGLPCFAVQHHMAHASALLGEQGADAARDCLVFTWDGVGYGDDGQLWGGEALYGRPGHWQRVASMRPFRLPGADRAGREPWRSAVSLAWEIGAEQVARQLLDQSPAATEVSSYELLHHAWRRAVNAPYSSAVGRLFDAAAAFTGVCRQASFEGQGPMWLESLAGCEVEPVMLPCAIDADGIRRSDWQPLVEVMMDGSRSVEERASLFHRSMAEALVQQALAVRESRSVQGVGLCGGVFQNRRLSEACVSRLSQCGFEVWLGERLPVNDAAISFGQVVEFACRT